jgi:amino acid transporter
MPPSPTRAELIGGDVRDLHGLGYAQQLVREMGGFPNFAVSFSIISVLTGAILLYGYGLKLAGPIVNSVGWPVVSLLTLAVAASMAELASAYPTAGGLYFWAFRLGGRGWAWLTAWLNMIGQVTITAGIDVAAAIYLIGAVTRILGLPADTPVPVYAAAYSVITSISTITLYLAYGIPIYLNWRNRRRGRGEYATAETAPWSLGRWGPGINAVALGWVALLAAMFSLPPNELTLWTMLAVLVGLGLYWWRSARHHFRGPTRRDEAELRRLEAAVEPETGVA